MKKILCFGDSNTYGYNPKDSTRLNDRWSALLKQKLFSFGFEVVEQGHNNRKCFIDDGSLELTSPRILPRVFNKTYDYLVLAVGINDTQKLYSTTQEDFKQGIINLVNIARKISPSIRILILSPSILKDSVVNHFYFSNLFDYSSIQKSKEIFSAYKSAAIETKCDIINLDDYASVSNIDGLHYDSLAHKTIAEKLFQYFTLE